MVCLIITLIVGLSSASNAQTAMWNSGCKTSPWGPVKVGYSNMAYSTALPAGPCSAVSETRTCSRKVMSGSFTNTSCTDGCAAGSTSNCNYVANSSGASSGTCASGFSGSCSFSCTNGVRAQVSNTCVSACGGTSMGGYCWYTDGSSSSCDVVCASHGGCNLTGTRDYTGSGGSLANCFAVMTALSVPGPNGSDNGSVVLPGLGCYYSAVAGRSRATGNTTTCAADGFQRVCACNN